MTRLRRSYLDTRVLALVVGVAGSCLAQPPAGPPLTPSQELADREVAAWNELPTDDPRALADRIEAFVGRFVGADPLLAMSLTRSAVLSAEPVVWDGFVSATTEIVKRLALETDDTTRRQHALVALTGLAEAERLRPLGADAASLDDETRAHLEKQLPAVGQFPNKPRRVLPPGPPGATQVAAADLPLQPDPRTSVAALADLGGTIDEHDFLWHLAIFFSKSPSTQARDFAERMLVTRCGSYPEAIALDTLRAQRHPHAEGACLLYLMRADGVPGWPSALLQKPEAWATPRAVPVLRLVLSYGEGGLARAASRVLSELTGVTHEVPRTPSLADQRELYRFWQRALENDPRGRVSPLDPAWDAEDPVVKALKATLNRFEALGDAGLAADAGANREDRKAALRRLAFTDTDDSWEGVERAVAAFDNPDVAGYGLTLLGAFQPARVNGVREQIVRGLRADPDATAQRLADGVAVADTKETVLALAGLVRDEWREPFLAALEDIATQHTGRLRHATPPLIAIRNSVAAYAEVSRTRAAAFYESLLSAPARDQQRVGIYGVGELRLAHTVERLLELLVTGEESCFNPGGVCVALAKIGTPAAHEALLRLVNTEPLHRGGHCWASVVMLCAASGMAGMSPSPCWENGFWATRAEDPAALAERAAMAFRKLAESTDDERWAKEIRGRAESVVRNAGNWTNRPRPPAPPPVPRAAAGTAQRSPTQRSPATWQEWLEQSLASLRTFVPDAHTPVLEIEGEGEWVSVNGPRGVLWLNRDDWVYLTCYSTHTSEPQIVLARDRGGSIRRLDAHVCPTLSLQSTTEGPIQSLAAFFATRGGNGERTWEVVEEAAAPPATGQPKSAFEHMREVALSPEARSYHRKAALTHLTTDCGAEGWQVVEQVLREPTDWEVRALALRLALERTPDGAEALREGVAASLPDDRDERVRLYRQWINEATTKEALQSAMTLVREEDRDALCHAFEEQARSHAERVFAQMRSFAALRNSVNAYGLLDHERAAAFYRALLEGATGHQREVAIYALGELRVTEALDDLLAALRPSEENCFTASSVCLALGKLGTPDAHEALIHLLERAVLPDALYRTVRYVMSETCGFPGASPPGRWANGCWATIAEDRRAAAERFATALEALAEKTTDAKRARGARNSAEYLLRQTRHLQP